MDRIVVGVISDTHGVLRSEVKEMLIGCDFIIHAGDVGKPEIIEELKSIAQVLVVRGNVDREHWAEQLPISETISLGNKRIHVLHDIKTLDIKPEASDIQVVISGHSHKPTEETRKGVVYLNPGSVGPRRFNLPISMAILIIDDNEININFVDL